MASNRPLGTISSFTLLHRAGYSCYARAAYCDSPKDSVQEWKIVLTDRIEGRINLGDGVTRSLKGLGIPEGATVQLVVEVVAAGSPKVMSQEAWTYSEDSFRTASYKVYGTVFNPKVERNVRRPPPPPPFAAAMQIPVATEETPLLLSEKQAMHEELSEADSYRSRLGAMFCCT